MWPDVLGHKFVAGDRPHCLQHIRINRAALARLWGQTRVRFDARDHGCALLSTCLLRRGRCGEHHGGEKSENETSLSGHRVFARFFFAFRRLVARSSPPERF